MKIRCMWNKPTRYRFVIGWEWSVSAACYIVSLGPIDILFWKEQ